MLFLLRMAWIICALDGALKKIRKLVSEVFERVQVIRYHCGLGLPVLEICKTSFSDHEGSTTLTGTRAQLRRLGGDGPKNKRFSRVRVVFLVSNNLISSHNMYESCIAAVHFSKNTTIGRTLQSISFRRKWLLAESLSSVRLENVLEL